MSEYIRGAEDYFRALAETQRRLPFAKIDDLATELVEGHQRGQTTFVFGNGGSAALSSHIVCDLAKGTAPPGGRGLRIAALADSAPLLTAWANDMDYSAIFAEQITTWGRPGDLALAVSCSGNSANVLQGLAAARALGMRTMALGGFQGGRMAALCDVCVIVPSDHMQIIEDLHHAIAHAVFLMVRDRLALPTRQATAGVR